MTQSWQFERASKLPPDLEPLADEARRENYEFIDRMIARWRAGEFCFDRPGEQFCFVRSREVLIGCGGLSIDPYLSPEEAKGRVGRVRHLYVLPSERGRGVGASLLRHILDESGSHFSKIRLPADSPDAARLYERFQFVPIDDATATHHFIPVRDFL